jgi:hypothetical protein
MPIKQKPVNDKGLIFRLKKYPLLQFNSGVANRSRIKSCFFEVKCHVESKDSDYYKVLNDFTYDLKSELNKFIPKSSFTFNYITTPNIPFNYIETGKSFISIEFTLFPKTVVNIDKVKIEFEQLASLMNGVADKMDYITFTRKKIYKNNKNYAKK